MAVLEDPFDLPGFARAGQDSLGGRGDAARQPTRVVGVLSHWGRVDAVVSHYGVSFDTLNSIQAPSRPVDSDRRERQRRNRLPGTGRAQAPRLDPGGAGLSFRDQLVGGRPGGIGSSHKPPAQHARGALTNARGQHRLSGRRRPAASDDAQPCSVPLPERRSVPEDHGIVSGRRRGALRGGPRRDDALEYHPAS